MVWVDQVVWMLLWGVASKSKQSQVHKYTDLLHGSRALWDEIICDRIVVDVWDAQLLKKRKCKWGPLSAHLKEQ